MPETTAVVLFTLRPGSSTARRELAALADYLAGRGDCLEYRLGESTTVPDTLIAYETWIDQAAFAAHGDDPHVQEVVAKIGPAFAAPPVVHVLRWPEPR